MDSINSSFCRKFSVLLHITPNVDESQSAARGFSQSPDDNRDDDLQYENNVMYHCGKRDILKRKYPHKGAFFRGSFFVARPAQKRKTDCISSFCKGFVRFPEPEAESSSRQTRGSTKGNGAEKRAVQRSLLPNTDTMHCFSAFYTVIILSCRRFVNPKISTS